MSTLDHELFFGAPTDLRLKPLLSFASSASSGNSTGGRVETLRQFGRSSRREVCLSDTVPPVKIDFTLRLAEPEVHGGVVVALLWPCCSRRKTSNTPMALIRLKGNCRILYYLDGVLLKVAGSSLLETSSFVSFQPGTNTQK